ncbi:hypothetical protein [Fervidobacterium sp.]
MENFLSALKIGIIGYTYLIVILFSFYILTTLFVKFLTGSDKNVSEKED